MRNAAKLIITEIQSAERKIKTLKKSVGEGKLDSDVSIITTNSWAKYKHFFTRLLDRDEWDDIEDFYDRATMLDDTVRYNSSMFRNDVEQIRVNKQRAVADFARDIVNNIGTTGEADRESIAAVFDSKVKVYDTLYMSKQDEIGYTPQRIIDDARKYLEGSKDILNSSAISKMKSMADTDGKSRDWLII